MNISVVLAPAEVELLPGRDLRPVTCVVFDVLRATSTMLAALAAGAEAIEPVAGIADAVRIKAAEPGVVLAGERDGCRITREVSGSVEFDLGNSPREMMPDRVAGRILVCTTTNGTKALRACAAAGMVWLGAFTNLAAMSRRLVTDAPNHLLLVCSGTGSDPCLEDIAGAGGLIERLISAGGSADLSDSARLALTVYQAHAGQLLAGISQAVNARRLLAIPELAPDVEWCLTLDRCALVARLHPDGRLRLA